MVAVELGEFGNEPRGEIFPAGGALPARVGVSKDGFPAVCTVEVPTPSRLLSLDRALCRRLQCKRLVADVTGGTGRAVLNVQLKIGNDPSFVVERHFP